MFRNQLPKSHFHIILLLLVFLLKGLLFVAILPIFQGPDEAIHYATVQYFAEPKEKKWPISQSTWINDANNIETYNFSEEIRKTAKISQFDEIKFHNTNTTLFSTETDGLQEKEITGQKWKSYIDTYPPAIVSGTALYYDLASVIEKSLSNKDILIRFFSIRLVSILLGMAVILLAYLTATKIGFSKKHSLLISAIVAFQPMFTQTAAIITYDIPLIFSFSLFIYATTSLLRDGFQWKYATILLISAILGTLSKGPGMVLIALIFPISGYIIQTKLNFNRSKFILYSLFGILVISTAFILFGPRDIISIFTNFSASPKFSSPIESIQKYAAISMGRWGFFELTYWGSFGWLDSRITNNFLPIIWLIEIVALAGLIYGLFFKKELPDFLPEKKYIFFFIAILLVLQGAIRFYDWRSYYNSGIINVGTPGRYFLPNIIAHFLVLFYGLGIFCHKRKNFNILLAFSFVLMVGLFLYSLFNIIIPRYYL